MVKKIFPVIIAILFIAGGLSMSVAASTPKNAIQTTIDAVLSAMKDKSLSAPSKKQERREKIGSLIRERFDFIEMSKRSLARHWKKISLDEKKEFVNIFSKLLEASYIGKIEAYTDEKVEYDKEKIKGKGKYSVVKTRVITKDVDIPIDYKLINKKDNWRIYDVIIEGVSFISTYRSQYDKIIAKQSFGGLLEDMKKKLQEIDISEEKRST